MPVIWIMACAICQGKIKSKIIQEDKIKMFHERWLAGSVLRVYTLPSVFIYPEHKKPPKLKSIFHETFWNTVTPWNYYRISAWGNLLVGWHLPLPPYKKPPEINQGASACCVKSKVKIFYPNKIITLHNIK